MFTSRKLSLLKGLAAACVTGSTIFAVACASSGSGQTTGIDTPLGTITIKTQAGQFHITLVKGQCGTLWFKDAKGNTIGTLKLTGPIDQDFPIPTGYHHYDYETHDCDKSLDTGAPGSIEWIVPDRTLGARADGSASPTQPLPPAGTQPAIPGGPYTPAPPMPAAQYSVTEGSDFLNDYSLAGYTYSLNTPAADEIDAQARFDAIKAAGAGAALPGAVTINAWVDVQAGGSVTAITSALHDSFRRYTITVDGAVVADLGTGQNATLQPLGNGWWQVTSYLPNSLGGTGADIVLTQKGQAASAANTTLAIDDI